MTAVAIIVMSAAATAAAAGAVAAAAAVVHLTGDDEAQDLIDLIEDLRESGLSFVHGLDGGHFDQLSLHVAQTIGHGSDGSLIGIGSLHQLLHALLQLVELGDLGLSFFVVVEGFLSQLHIAVLVRGDQKFAQLTGLFENFEIHVCFLFSLW